MNGAAGATSTPGHDIVITNNLWQRIVASVERSLMWVGAAHSRRHNVTFTHNTIRNINREPSNAVQDIGSGIVINGQHRGQTNLVVKDNIYSYGPSGFAYSPHGYQGSWPPSGIVEGKNIVVVDNEQWNAPRAILEEVGQMPNSYRLANDAAVGFSNVAGADAAEGGYYGYALAVSSPFKGGASDGTDPGVDFAALAAALSGRLAGGLQAPSNLVVR